MHATQLHRIRTRSYPSHCGPFWKCGKAFRQGGAGRQTSTLEVRLPGILTGRDGRLFVAALAHSPIRVASPRQDRQEPLPVTPQHVAVRLAIVNKVDDVIEEPRQNQLRIGIADTDAEPRWLRRGATRRRTVGSMQNVGIRVGRT